MGRPGLVDGLRAARRRPTQAPAPHAGGASAGRGWALWYRARPRVLVVAGVSGIVVLLAWPAITRYYSYNDAFYNSVVAVAAASAILTISLNLCMGYGGMLSLMHTGLQLAGGYAVAALSVKAALSPWLGLVLAIAVGTAFAFVTLLVSLRATYLYFGMITLAASLIAVEIGREWDSVTGGIVGIAGVPRPALGSGAPMTRTQFYYFVLAALALAYLVQRNLVRSGLGRAAMAVRESPETAAALGIRPSTTRLLLFSISGGLGGLAGALYAMQLGFINPDVGLLDNGLIFFVGLLLGGIGTLLGPLFGVAAVTAVDFVIRGSGDYRTLVLGLILLAAMVVMPRGIVGTWRASRLGWDLVEDRSEQEAVGKVPESVPPVPSGPDVPALEGRGIVQRFGGVTALDGVDVSVAPGTVHGIIGPNGSGKSTLVSCLTRFLHPDEGEVRIFGAPAPRAPHQVCAKGVTRVFQVPHLFERVSALDNVLTGMRAQERTSWVQAVLRSPAWRREDAAMRAQARELLAFAGLAGRAEAVAAALSHGQKRLLEVVRAVATRPRVLILDEPATGLTSAEIEALARLIRALRGRGLSVVLIEHNVEFVLALCDTVTVLDGGAVIAEGTPEQVRGSEAVVTAYLGRPDLVPDLAEERG